MIMHKIPDYIGNWMLSDDREQFEARNRGAGMSILEYDLLSNSGFGIFFMFINNSVREENNEKIAGDIIDNYRGFKSTFEGTMGKAHIEFTKKYSQEAVETGEVPLEIPYSGKRVGPFNFGGTYDMKDSDGKKWKGQFNLIKNIGYILN